jgi:hypothetical protein
VTPNICQRRSRPRRSEGPARIFSSVLQGRAGGHCCVHEMRQEDQACALPARKRGRQDPSGRPRGNRFAGPHEGTCQGVPPLRREPYAGLRRVSHVQCPERSRRRGRRVLAGRLRARADRRGVREAVQTALVGFCGVEDAAGTVSDIIAARIQPAAVEMMDALALQAAEPRSAACRPDATSLTRWTGAGTPVWHSTRTAALSR